MLRYLASTPVLVTCDDCDYTVILDSDLKTHTVMESYRRNSCNTFSQGLISVGLNSADMDKENNNYSKVAMAQAQLMASGGTSWLQRTFRRSKSEYRRKHSLIQVNRTLEHIIRIPD